MNMHLRFIDAGYWIALINRSDAYHHLALALSHTLTGRFVATEAVLFEVANALSRQRWRPQTAALLAEIMSTPTIEVVAVTRELFQRAVQLFTARPDKEWGPTDCLSFVVMRERGITEALAADQHFVQAGFRALLREG